MAVRRTYAEPSATLHYDTIHASSFKLKTTMILDRAFILLLASIGAVTGFTPSCRSTFSVAVSSQSSSNNVAFPQRRVISSLFSEVEHATETASSAAKSGFETAIYVGNISFDTSESDIMAAFATHGVVSKVQVPTDRETVSNI